MTYVARLGALVGLLFVDGWLIVTLVNAIGGGRGEGFVFWAAIVVILVLLLASIYATAALVRSVNDQGDV